MRKKKAQLGKHNMRKIYIILMVSLLSLSLGACSGNKNPLTDEEVKFDVRASLLRNKNYEFKELLSYTIESSTLTEDSFTQIISLVFTTTEAEVSGKMRIEYYKGEKVWLMKSTNLSEVVGKANEAPDLSDLQITYYETSWLGEEKYLWTYFDEFQGEITLSASNINFDLEKQSLDFEVNGVFTALNFTGNITRHMKGQYDFEKGWTYTILSESYEETTDWNGSWKADLYTWSNGVSTFKRTVEIISSGKIKVTNDGAGHEEVTNDTSATFTLDGHEYTVNGLTYLDINDGHATSREVIFSFGSGANESLTMVVSFNTNPINATPYRSCSFDEAYGELIKLD
jgi:hypothetical protein